MTAYASGARTDGLFDQARAAVSVLELVQREGLKALRAGKEHRSACPMCGAGSKSKTAFAIRDEGLKWRCYGGCDRGGDVVDLEQELRGGTAMEAARRLVGRDVPMGSPRPRPEPKKTDDGPSSAERLAIDLWRTSRPLAGTLAERYLRHRGISDDVIAQAAENLRFHPHAKHSWDPRTGQWVVAPAMMAQVVTPLGPTGGVHVTYLARDGQGKAQIRQADGAFAPAKRMWGPQLDAEGRPGGAWLIGPDGGGDLVVAEGIETALSVATLGARAGRPVRAVAALSLARLQGGLKRDDDGCVDAIHPVGNPDHPAFTWPCALVARPWKDVRIAVDRDMAEIRVKAKTGRGRICQFLLTAENRARICGRLAAAAWKQACPEARVQAIAPPPGRDFNDELRRVLALECGK